MKTIKITLTEAEYHGIRQYLEQDDDLVTSVDIRRYVGNLDGLIEGGSLS